MSSLTELNSYSNNTVTFTDNRPSNVIFNYPSPRDITTTLTGNVFPVQKSIDILEIINPSVANVTFEIDVSAVAGSSVQWSSLPSNISITGAYKLYGISSVSDWETVLNGTIVLPITFNGSFFYTITITYINDNVLQTLSWQVGNYLPEVLIETSSSVSCTPNRIRGTAADLIFSAQCVQTFYEAQLVNRFNLSVLSKSINPGAATLTSKSTVDFFQPLMNMSPRTYNSNVPNTIFQNETPSELSTLNHTFAPSQVTTDPQQGNHHISFDSASTEYLKIFNTNDNIKLGSSDFTIEFWINPYITPGYQMFIFDTSSGGTISQAPYIFIDGNGRIKCFLVGTMTLQGPILSSTAGYAGWSHVAVTVTGRAVRFYVNGVAVAGASAGVDIDIANEDIVLGKYTGTPTYDYNGYMDSFRLSNNVRYTGSSYTPPTTEFVPDANTRYLRTWSAEEVFSPTSPYIRYVSGVNDYELTLIATSGNLSSDSGTTQATSIVISGTDSQVNSSINDVIFYPPYNTTSNITISYALEQDNVAVIAASIPLIHDTAGTLTSRTFAVNTTNSALTIPYEEIEYGQFDILLVGGGGGGASGGGGGGQLKQLSSVLLSHASSFNVQIGSGGAAANMNFGHSNQPALIGSGSATTGGNTTAFGYTAEGGGKGSTSEGDGTPVVGNTYTGGWDCTGGDTKDNAGNVISGGDDSLDPTETTRTVLASDDYLPYVAHAGGGGAGGNAPGVDASIGAYDNSSPPNPVWVGGNGGNGATSSIIGTTTHYGGGGAGGAAQAGTTFAATHVTVGGLGGGGQGFSGSGGYNQLATQGTDNLGGGGGGGKPNFSSTTSYGSAMRGGKGVVIVKVTAK